MVINSNYIVLIKEAVLKNCFWSVVLRVYKHVLQRTVNIYKLTNREIKHKADSPKTSTLKGPQVEDTSRNDADACIVRRSKKT